MATRATCPVRHSFHLLLLTHDEDDQSHNEAGCRGYVTPEEADLLLYVSQCPQRYERTDVDTPVEPVEEGTQHLGTMDSLHAQLEIKKRQSN